MSSQRCVNNVTDTHLKTHRSVLIISVLLFVTLLLLLLSFDCVGGCGDDGGGLVLLRCMLPQTQGPLEWEWN